MIWPRWSRRQSGAANADLGERGEAQVPAGVPENVVRTVTENSRALKFDSHGFERE